MIQKILNAVLDFKTAFFLFINLDKLFLKKI